MIETKDYLIPDSSKQHGAPTFCFLYHMTEDYEYVRTKSIPPICLPPEVPFSGCQKIIISVGEPLVKAGLESKQIRLTVDQLNELLTDYKIDYDPKTLKREKAAKLVDHIFKDDPQADDVYKEVIVNAICGCHRKRQDPTLVEIASCLDAEETLCFSQIINDAIRDSNRNKRESIPVGPVHREAFRSLLK